MIRCLALSLVMFGIVSSAYAGAAGRIAARNALRAAMAKKTAVSVAALVQMQAASKARLLAKDENTTREKAMPDYRKRRGDATSGFSRRRGGDTVDSGKRSTRRDSWEKSSSVFDERGTGERRGNAP